MILWLDDHQTLVAAALGFVGVILTLFINAWLERRQHYHERVAEADALRRGLAEELRLLQEVLEDRRKSISEAEQDGSTGLLVPMTNTTEIFIHSIDRLGLLRSDQVSAVLRAYLYVRQMSEKLSLTGRVLGADRERAVNVGSEYFHVIKRIHEYTSEEVSKALQALAKP